VFEKPKSGIERSTWGRVNGYRVELLHAIERTGHGFVLDRRHSAQWNQLSIWTADINVFQLLRIQAFGPLDLGNNLVTSAGDIEPIDEVAADAGRKIGPNQLHVETHRGHLVVIEHNLGLRLIDFRIDI